MNRNREYWESVRTGRGILWAIVIGLAAWLAFMVLWVLLLALLGRSWG